MNLARLLKSVVTLFSLACVLCACNLAQTPTKKDTSDTPTSFSSLETAREKQELGTVAKPDTSNSLLSAMLQRGDDLLKRGHALSPESDNAYVRYRAAKLLVPNSAEAQAGLDAVLIGELEKVRTAFAAGKTRSAEAKLSELDTLFPGSTLVTKMYSDFAKMQKARLARQKRTREAQSASAAQSQAVFQEERHALDVHELGQRSERVVKQLVDLAKQVEVSDQGVLIYARNDAEGRWVYKQMRNATPEYRIRGDIRISATPRIVLLKPFSH